MLRPLFDNHLAFMRLHRGEIHGEGGGLTIRSEAPGVDSWVPLAETATVPETCAAVRLVPWSGDGWPDRLAALGFRPAEALAYMELPEGTHLGGSASADADIAIVADDKAPDAS